MALENHEESRLRQVEEAIIEFRSIAKTVIVDLKERVRVLEKNDTEIDDRIAFAISKVASVFSWVMAGLFSLFCGALLYLVTEIATVKETNNTKYVEMIIAMGANHEGTVKNTIKFDNIAASLIVVNSKLDEVLKHDHAKGVK